MVGGALDIHSLAWLLFLWLYISYQVMAFLTLVLHTFRYTALCFQLLICSISFASFFAASSQFAQFGLLLCRFLSITFSSNLVSSFFYCIIVLYLILHESFFSPRPKILRKIFFRRRLKSRSAICHRPIFTTAGNDTAY